MKISKNFHLEEKVPESIYLDYGNNAIKFLDPRSIILSQKLRDYLGVPMIINNWKDGGPLNYRGFRPFGCGVGSDTSQHCFGRADDFDSPLLSPQEIRAKIVKVRDSLFPEITFIEVGINWVHVDMRKTWQDKLIFWHPKDGIVKYEEGI